MEVIILPDVAAIGALGADAIQALLERKPDAVLGLATGSSPLAIYDELAARHAAGSVSFAQARGFTLDEYVGLPADHPERYRTVIDTVFVNRVDFAPGAVQGPDGLASDIPAACAAYEAAISAAGGVDLQILGIGTDGHIGFNEPGSSLASRTRIKTLTHQTRVDNARFFDDDVDAFDMAARGDFGNDAAIGLMPVVLRPHFVRQNVPWPVALAADDRGGGVVAARFYAKNQTHRSSDRTEIRYIKGMEPKRRKTASLNR